MQLKTGCPAAPRVFLHVFGRCDLHKSRENLLLLRGEQNDNLHFPSEDKFRPRDNQHRHPRKEGRRIPVQPDSPGGVSEAPEHARPGGILHEPALHVLVHVLYPQFHVRQGFPGDFPRIRAEKVHFVQ